MSMHMYRQAGVDLDKANELVNRIKPLVRTTFNSGVITDIGGFGGLYSINCHEMNKPVLVSSTDGVGTKLKVAFWSNRHNTVGIDLVAMCVNDIIVQGARPLFFLDYLAMGRLDLDLVEQLITGIVAGCKEAGSLAEVSSSVWASPPQSVHPKFRGVWAMAALEFLAALALLPPIVVLSRFQ